MSPEDAVAPTGGVESVRTCPVQRARSDSAVPSCRIASIKENISIKGHEPSITSLPPCTCGDHRPSVLTTTSTGALLQRVKDRQNLQLPSFRSLGIAAGALTGPSGVLAIGALPTPPDEISGNDLPLIGSIPDLPPRSISFTEGILPTTPGFHKYPNPFYTAASNEPVGDITEHSNPAATNTDPTETTTTACDFMTADQDTPRAGTTVQQFSEKGSDGGESDDGGFVVGAIPFTGRVITGNDAPVLHAMCYTQPCPLAGAETAFDPILADMESKARQTGKYIEVTYQMPPKFNMNQIPSSPAATPTSELGSIDYFSTHVYTRGIVAQNYETVLAQAGSSSPRPAVAPGSINVAMLERYIPPPSLDEYTNLFSTDMPSALVDRLFELSPKNGTLVFVYPTAQGAKTFFSNYLRPLLDPLLRTIASTHELSADLPASVGALASLHGELLSFDRTVTKINALLRKLSRPSSLNNHSSARTIPTFSLVHSDKSVVDIGKEALVDWWLEQEKGRIRKAVDRYFHSRRAESTMGMTAKIEEGLRKRDYNDYDAERSGIEVGLYVITRTS